MKYETFVSDEDLSTIECNECDHRVDSLTTKRFRRLFNEIERLRGQTTEMIGYEWENNPNFVRALRDLLTECHRLHIEDPPTIMLAKHRDGLRIIQAIHSMTAKELGAEPPSMAKGVAVEPIAMLEFKLMGAAIHFPVRDQNVASVIDDPQPQDAGESERDQ